MEYHAILFSEIEEVQSQITVLTKGVSENRRSIALLCQAIETGIAKGRFRPLETELTAQIIWTSTFGLITKILLEKELPSNQQQALINHHFKMLLHGLLR
ncbi:MAG TPA: hypothetical protein VHY08_05320 [Bacillota bacterium]|nr:hypothetical protein [Bacillota bacterium]